VLSAVVADGCSTASCTDLALTRISPNVLTFIGLVINIVAAFFFGHANATNSGKMFFYAGLVIFGAGIFDMVDGRVARRINKVTVFGSFFDSVIDRYSDVVLFFGCSSTTAASTVSATLFSSPSSWSPRSWSATRAPAPRLSSAQCKVGFMERPERVVLILLGALFNHWAGVMAPVLWVLAVLSTITVVHRITYTYSRTKHLAPIA
jgi:CDP-diacylglycerol--glycerol-3-phosphate 3-phosphatidyltransferase